MTTAFMDRWATVKANFDVTFGEVFTVLPRVKPGVNARAIPDHWQHRLQRETATPESLQRCVQRLDDVPS